MLLRSRSSIATKCEKQPLKKKRKKKASLVLPHTTISSLPDDLVFTCLARVSRLYYPTLSLVSKKFRSLISSPELYKVRSLLGRAESSLYVCLDTFHRSDSRWFTLCRRPKMKKKKKKSSENLLVPIPSPQADYPGVVAIGSSIYSIGGFIDYQPSSNVSILDCKSHTWHQAPNMQLPRRYLSANVIDGKIYVIGRRDDYRSSPLIEVFDPKTQIWNSFPCPSQVSNNIHTAEIDGKICMYTGGGKGVGYNPKDGTVESIEWNMCQAWVCYSHCVVDHNLPLRYYPHEKVFQWFDTKARLWRDLKGLEGILRKIAKCSCVKLADYGGRIAVLWDKCFSSKGCKEKMIWFAEISLERRHNDEEEEEDEIWGRVEFVDCVLTVPKLYEVLKAISATL